MVTVFGILLRCGATLSGIKPNAEDFRSYMPPSHQLGCGWFSMNEQERISVFGPTIRKTERTYRDFFVVLLSIRIADKIAAKQSGTSWF